MRQLAKKTMHGKALAFLRWRKAHGGAVARPQYGRPDRPSVASLLKSEVAPVDETFAFRSRHWQMPRLGRYEE